MFDLSGFYLHRMARELQLRIQQLGNPWEPPSDDDLQLLSEVAQLIRSAPPDVVASLPLLEMLHKARLLLHDLPMWLFCWLTVAIMKSPTNLP